MTENENLTNFADDSDDELDTNGSSERFREAVLYGTDWTIRTLLQQIEDGNIELSPNFQRRDAWSTQNKSRFIESVALQLPIPQIVLAERKEQRGTYIVLDGKQRLLTLAQFAGQFPSDHKIWRDSARRTPLKLSGLKVIDELNNRTYADISENSEFSHLKTQFDNHTIRSALIRNWPDDDYLYEVFIRLNTGSSKLSPQELRQAMKPGAFTDFLSQRSAESDSLQKLLSLKAPDFRMRDVDLLLRLIAFAINLPSYKGNLKPFLDDTQKQLNFGWQTQESRISELAKSIEASIDALAKSFGEYHHVGRRWSQGEFEAPVNRAVLDVQIGAMLDPRLLELVQANKIDIRGEFIRLCDTNTEFVQSISGTTKSIVAINARYTIWQQAVSAAAGFDVNMPKLPKLPNA